MSRELDPGALRALLATARSLAEARTLDHLVAATCSSIRTWCDADGVKLTLARERDPDDALGAFVAGYLTHHRETFAISDLGPEHRELARTIARSLVVVPVIASSAPIAGIAVFWARVDGPTPRTVAMLEALAELVAPTLDMISRLARETEARRGAERVARSRDEFVDALAQGLRNPLAPIVTALHLIELRGGDPFEREREVIRQQVGSVVRIVDDLLDVSRIKRDALQLRRTRAELGWIVSRGLEVAAAALAQRGHAVVADVPTSGLVIDADIDRMTQVVANLVVNAAKATPRGGRIEVIASVELDTEGDDRCARLVVRDTGSGIEPLQLPQLFDPFTYRRGELGLGLALVRSFVELHGGVVSAASDGPGRGSTFTVRLPLCDDADPPITGRPPRGTRPLRVLVVDTNVESASTLGELLQLMGHQTVVVHDGDAALATAERFAPEVALLDIAVVDGHELSGRMRAMPGLAEAPLVALTGFARPADRQRARECGCDGHIAKPVSAEKLRFLLEKLTP